MAQQHEALFAACRQHAVSLCLLAKCHFPAICQGFVAQQVEREPQRAPPFYCPTPQTMLEGRKQGAVNRGEGSNGCLDSPTMPSWVGKRRKLLRGDCGSGWYPL